ncbi:MAG: hypothetical protein IPK82_37410 [Polyangiaceae bacterium]|nr:hypothetical protein [Polyangiaceae bacterium]
MNLTKHIGWPVCLSLVLAAPSLAGCGGIVSKGGDNFVGDGGSGGSGGAGGSVGEGGGCDPGCPAPQALAMTWAQMEAAGTGSGGSSTTGSGGGVDPNKQFLLFGGGYSTPACTNPYGSSESCGGWYVSISVDPALFQVGVIPFSDPGLDINMYETIDEGNGLCSGGGGGGFEEGQLEIIEITPTQVHFNVTGVEIFFNQDPNGARVAERCQ